jgi:hypothetical protein
MVPLPGGSLLLILAWTGGQAAKVFHDQASPKSKVQAGSNRVSYEGKTLWSHT